MSGQKNELLTVILPISKHCSDKTLESIKTKYPSAGWIHFSKEIKKSTSLLLFPEDQDISCLLILREDQTKLGAVIAKYEKAGSDYKGYISEKISIDLHALEDYSSENLQLFLRNATIGLFLGIHPAGHFKSEKEETQSDTFISYTGVPPDDVLNDSITRGRISSDTIQAIRNLVNLPSNKKNPQVMADWLQSSAEKNKYKVSVLEEAELEKLGFNALLAVNRGSEIPAKCLIAEYRPESTTELPTIALVGKGVTFDTGGLSIKGSQNMHYMKSDMGGAAAVMGTIELVSKMNLQVHLIAIVPTTDNSVDALSIKPGDIIQSFSGKTIEIIDTDAEGRLIMADALSFVIQKYKPEVVLDLATLTGSVVRALGTESAGVMCKNEELLKQLILASEVTNERIWPLPTWDDYNEYLQSDLADIRNLGTKPVAGAITAGKFLEAFTHGHQKWAHLDIAGVAYGNVSGYKGYMATGFGILLLTEWIKTNYHG